MRRLAFLLLVLLPGCSLFGSSTPHYVVFFTEDSTALDDAARGVVGQAAYEAIGVPGTPVRVLGYTAMGNAPAVVDGELAKRRAEAVAAALTADGVSADRLHIEPRGQTDSDPRVEARRVEIIIVH